MKNFLFTVTCIAAFLLFQTTPLQAQSLDGKVTSIFIYNFTKYIKWPSSAESGDFVIGIIGETPVEAELQKLTAKVKVNGVRPISIKKITSITNTAAMQGCHILYISDKGSRALKEITAAVGNASVLVVSEGMGMVNKGSIISIYVDEETDKIKLELNKKVLEQHQLKASSDLLALAVVI